MSISNEKSANWEYSPCSFIGISQTLPTTAYVKMVDVWMIVSMIVPFLEVALHSYGWRKVDKPGVTPPRSYGSSLTNIDPPGSTKIVPFSEKVPIKDRWYVSKCLLKAFRLYFPGLFTSFGVSLVENF